VAAFLRERDGCDAQASAVFLTDGASAGVRNLMQCMLGEAGVDAILAPSPVYPLYSALSTLMDGAAALYPLSEDPATGEWTVSVEQLQRALDQARSRGARPRGLVVINPGNPTGQCMSLPEVTDILAFAAREGLVLMADEVYQANVYNTPGAAKRNQFHSFRRALAALRESDPALASRVQLVSMHSTSKGFCGECGLRGGFAALDGAWDPVVKSQMVKLASISLCSNVVGQLAMGCIVHPPAPGDASHDAFVRERDRILASLKERADSLASALDALPGVTCAPVEGALYLFPRISLPAKAVAAAAKAGVAADEFYAMRLLDATGLVVVPGSGFGQPDPDAFHVRTTFLPPAEKLQLVVKAIQQFHTAFLDEFGGEAARPAV
jgi:alanine transaminase